VSANIDHVSKPRLQHEIPRFYLDHFKCRHSGRVEAFDLANKKLFCEKPLELARVRDSYVFTETDGTKNHAVDDLLEHCEDLVAKPTDGVSPYDKVVAGATLSADDRAAFSLFVASMHVRSPFVRRQVAELKAAVLGARGREIAGDNARWAECEEDLRRLGDYSPEVAARCRQRLLAQDYVLETSREGTLIAVAGLPDFADIVHSMQWSILRTSRGQFVTCDSPLVHKAGRFAPNGGVDLRDKLSTLSLPLTSSACWIGHWRTDRPRVIRATPKQIRIYNQLRALNAERQIYAVPLLQNLPALAATRDDPNSGIRLESIIPEKRPKVHVVRHWKKDGK
jgi:hypothetical protein